MTKEQANFLVETIENSGNEAEIRDDYSGRGMFGKSTYGVVTKINPANLLGVALTHIKDSLDCIEDIPDFGDLRTDSMGLSTIIY